MANIDMGGVENVSVALVRQARNDFIKGAKILYKHLKTIPTQIDLLKNAAFKTLSNLKEVRWMYDAWRFVKNDPYEMFGEVGEETIIKSWSDAAIIDHYKDLYLLGATILYVLNAKKKKEIYELADSSVIKKIGNKEISDNFITARNAILELDDGRELLDQWNVIAFEKSKRREKDIAKGKISKNDPIKLKENKRAELTKKERMERMLKAKELFDSGMSKEDIAKELGVTKSAVYRYIREAKDLES